MSELPKWVRDMLDPEIYPHEPDRVELMQTQMSFVFIAGDYVYKVKKPVNLGYLNYTSLDKRHHFCQKEVELNRRLCPEVYLDVVPITRNKDGVTLGGQGKVIDYAVKMLRLPQEAMMDRLLLNKKVTAKMVANVAEKLAAFHGKAETNASIGAFGKLDIINKNNWENFFQTKKYIGSTISEETYQNIQNYTRGFVAQNASLFRRRIIEGRIRDCHGDLHAAHVCFTDGICIYDCIEFNDRFRYCDVASEVAFLAMDLDNYGRADLSRRFVEAYVKASQDREIEQLLDFYKCYRAYVRGKVNCFTLDDPHISPEEKAGVLAKARGYFELAESYII